MTFFPILWRKSVLCPASASAASRRRSLSFLLAMDCRKCSKPAVRRTVQKNNANHGREFITCSNAAGGCKYFEWVDGKPSNVGAAARPVTSLAAKYSSDSAASAVPQANTLVVYTDGACIGMLYGVYLVTSFFCIISSFHVQFASLCINTCHLLLRYVLAAAHRESKCAEEGLSFGVGRGGGEPGWGTGASTR